MGIPSNHCTKKKGKWRVCINYKALNKVTKKDRYPLPFIDEILDAVAGHELFSFCDSYAGYHQVAICKEDRWMTIFTTPYGTYWYLRMPFGMCNSAGTFQRVQMKVLEPYLGKIIRVYLDDFCVYGDRANHVEQLRLTFEQLTLFQCNLSPEKMPLWL
jgi:hypothetical protein